MNMEIQCQGVVMEEEDMGNGVMNKKSLSNLVTIKPESGNARLVSRDRLIWLKDGSISVNPNGRGGKIVRVRQKNRTFIFHCTDNTKSKEFIDQLQKYINMVSKKRKRTENTENKDMKKQKEEMEARQENEDKEEKEVKGVKEDKEKNVVEEKKGEKSFETTVVQTLLSPKRVKKASLLSPSRGPNNTLRTPSPAVSKGTKESRNFSIERVPSVTRSVRLNRNDSNTSTPITKRRTLSPCVAPLASLFDDEFDLSQQPSTNDKKHMESNRRASTGSSENRECYNSRKRPRPDFTPTLPCREAPKVIGSTENHKSPALASSGKDPSRASLKRKLPIQSQDGETTTSSPHFHRRVRKLVNFFDARDQQSYAQIAAPEGEDIAGSATDDIEPFDLDNTSHELSMSQESFEEKKASLASSKPSAAEANSIPDTVNSNDKQGDAKISSTTLTHGLLNLGNYCYMNAILQSIVALPGFVSSVRNEKWLHGAIQQEMTFPVSLDAIEDAVSTWRKQQDGNDTDSLRKVLDELLSLISEGSTTSITPEPLKVVMGRKNITFATDLQQDAHEFLLSLINEYEKELVETIDGVVDLLKQSQEAKEKERETYPERKSISQFFRSPVKANVVSPTRSNVSDEEKRLCNLLPAQNFRGEFFRTLECVQCNYNRKKSESFYDISLDLPSRSENSTSGTQPKRCYCGTVAAVVSQSPKDGESKQIACCATNTCSFQSEAVQEETPKSQTNVDTDTQSDGNEESSISIVSSSPVASLESLLGNHFASETLELKCEECKTGNEAIAACEAKSLPPVLVLHLKRFEVDMSTGTLYKRSDPVEAATEIFPRQCINRSVSENEEPYVLKCVVHHIGKSINEGHYMTDVCGTDGQWRRHNDTQETQISEDFVLRATNSQESCYMFIYVRSSQAPEIGQDVLQNADAKDTEKLGGFF